MGILGIAVALWDGIKGTLVVAAVMAAITGLLYLWRRL